MHSQISTSNRISGRLSFIHIQINNCFHTVCFDNILCQSNRIWTRWKCNICSENPFDINNCSFECVNKDMKAHFTTLFIRRTFCCYCCLWRTHNCSYFFIAVEFKHHMFVVYCKTIQKENSSTLQLIEYIGWIFKIAIRVVSGKWLKFWVSFRLVAMLLFLFYSINLIGLRRLQYAYIPNKESPCAADTITVTQSQQWLLERIITTVNER